MFTLILPFRYNRNGLYYVPYLHLSGKTGGVTYQSIYMLRSEHNSYELFTFILSFRYNRNGLYHVSHLHGIGKAGGITY